MEQQAVTRGPVTRGRPAAGWWWFLVTGIAWLLVSLILFRFDVTSVSALGIMAGQWRADPPSSPGGDVG